MRCCVSRCHLARFCIAAYQTMYSVRGKRFTSPACCVDSSSIRERNGMAAASLFTILVAWFPSVAGAVEAAVMLPSLYLVSLSSSRDGGGALWVHSQHCNLVSGNASARGPLVTAVHTNYTPPSLLPHSPARTRVHFYPCTILLLGVTTSPRVTGLAAKCLSTFTNLSFSRVHGRVVIASACRCTTLTQTAALPGGLPACHWFFYPARLRALRAAAGLLHWVAVSTCTLAHKRMRHYLEN